jgi:dTMP kinase
VPLPQRGKFITFEGLDGVGKSTQLENLANYLRERGLDVITTREPGGTALGEKLRTVLLSSRTAGLSPRTELALMFADRAQHIDEQILPALERGQWVLCDRFTDSSEAYQGGGRQLGSQVVLDLHVTLCRGLQPDLTLLLLPDFDRSLERARRRNQRAVAATGSDENRFETESAAFYRRVFDKYREIAAREPSRVVAIDSDGSIDEVHQRVVQVVRARLATV